MQHCNLRRPRPCLNATSAAVEADAAVRCPVVIRDIASINIVDPVDIDPVHCRVIAEVIVIPVAAVVSIAEVSKAIVNAAIETNVQSPESVVEAIAPAVESPVTRSPQCARIRRCDPRARNPVISLGAPRPVARCPQIVGVRSWRLVIFRQRRRRLVGLLVRQIALVQIRGLLVGNVAVVRRPVVVAVLPGIACVLHSPLNRCRRLLRIVLCLLLSFILRVLPQHLRRLSISARRSHIHIGGV
jgi:hypothetical protein